MESFLELNGTSIENYPNDRNFFHLSILVSLTSCFCVMDTGLQLSFSYGHVLFNLDSSVSYPLGWLSTVFPGPLYC